MEHFGAVFKLDLTEETRTHLQEEEAVASSCLILATPISIGSCCYCVGLFTTQGARVHVSFWVLCGYRDDAVDSLDCVQDAT